MQRSFSQAASWIVAFAAVSVPAVFALAACRPSAPEPSPREPSMEASSMDSVSVATTPAETPPPPNRCIRPMASVAPPTPPPATTCPPDPLAGHMPKLPIVELHFPDQPQATLAKVEIATPPDWTERGLMFRPEIPEDYGMLFDLEENKDHEFWMHNTCASLDLMYIDGDGTIVGIVESAPTMNDNPLGVGCFSSFVLEVKAGWSRRHGVRPGQKIALPSTRSYR